MSGNTRSVDQLKNGDSIFATEDDRGVRSAFWRGFLVVRIDSKGNPMSLEEQLPHPIPGTQGYYMSVSDWQKVRNEQELRGTQVTIV